MTFIRQQVLSGGLCAGAWCNLGSTLTVEMACLAGFDWVLIDLEHGSSDFETLVRQAGVLSFSRTAAIVRIAWNDPPRFKRVLDLGVSGVMVPYVTTAEEARQAARSMRYPPDGIRGVAYLNRASGFGQNFKDYFRQANDNLLTIVQIETEQAVANAAEIADVEGVDVLFVGPLDLSVSLGLAQQFNHPRFTEALTAVNEAARSKGKRTGILISGEDQLPAMVQRGFSFIAMGSDAGMVSAGMRKNMEAFRKHTR